MGAFGKKLLNNMVVQKIMSPFLAEKKTMVFALTPLGSSSKR